MAALGAVILALAVAAPADAVDRLYWADQTGNKIVFADVDGGNPGKLNTFGATMSVPTGLAIDVVAGRLYWANSQGDTISFANLNNSGGGDLAMTQATLSSPQGVAIDPAGGKIYWANQFANHISFARL